MELQIPNSYCIAVTNCDDQVLLLGVITSPNAWMCKGWEWSHRLAAR